MKTFIVLSILILGFFEFTTKNYAAQNTIPSAQTLQPSVDVSCLAGLNATLSAGFQAKTGSTIYTSNDLCKTCENNLSLVVAPEEISTKVEHFNLEFDEYN